MSRVDKNTSTRPHRPLSMSGTPPAAKKTKRSCERDSITVARTTLLAGMVSIAKAWYWLEYHIDLNNKNIQCHFNSTLVRHYIDKSLDKISIIGFSLIIGGGIGNIFDRIVYGSVTDFLYLDFGGIFKTGIFNIADLSVTTGMILILISSFKKNS